MARILVEEFRPTSQKGIIEDWLQKIDETDKASIIKSYVTKRAA